MSVLDEWNEQLTLAEAGMDQLRLSPLDAAAEEPPFTLDHRAEFLSQ